MNINITVEDYFKDLKLMEQQYGQEEDLYPWIYMLLQMAECSKQKKQGESYNSVSIRDVHNYKKNTVPDDIEEPRRQVFIKLVEKLGPPEFLILTKNSEKILGCIEMKREEELIELKNGEYTINILEPIKIQLKYSIVIKSELEEQAIVDWKKKIEKELIINDIEFSNIKQQGKNRNTYYFYVEIDKLNNNVINKINAYESKMKEIHKILVGNEEYEVYGFNKRYIWEKDVTVNCDEGNPITRQLVSHLEKYLKVIYTDGLRFYYLKLIDSKEKKNTIYVKKIADVRSMYEEFCNHKENWKPQKENQWDKLLFELQEIDWHSEPTVKIPTDNKED